MKQRTLRFRHEYIRHKFFTGYFVVRDFDGKPRNLGPFETYQAAFGCLVNLV